MSSSTDDQKAVLNVDEFEKYTWTVIESYFKDNGGKALITHQVESFNDFILNKMEEIINGFNTIEIFHKFSQELDAFEYNIEIDVTEPTITKPTIYEKNGSTKMMMPHEARQRNFSYSSSVYVTFQINCKWYDKGVQHNAKKTMKNICIGKIPIMVGSNYCNVSQPMMRNFNNDECKYDFGGYFIVNGNEKVVISHDRIAENKTYVFLDNKMSQYSHVAEIRSVPDNNFGPPKLTSLKLSSKPTQFGYYIKSNMHHIRVDIPLFVLFRALGVESDLDIVRHVTLDTTSEIGKLIINQLKGSIEEANNITTHAKALEYLSRNLNISGYPKEIILNKTKRLAIIMDILKYDFLPHVGDDLAKKALYLGYMTSKLLKCFIGITDMDDRDSYLNKRVDTPGIMVANLFRQYYGRVVKDIKNSVVKELNTGCWKASNDITNLINKNNIYKIVKVSTIESGLKYALATGNWGIKNGNVKQGVAQVLNRLTYNATLSHLRRINTPMEKSGKLIQPRKLHNTQWGIICPAETPEGGSVGLVKNLAISTKITIASDSRNVRQHLQDLGTIMYNDKDDLEKMHNHTKIIINGDFVGIHLNPSQLFFELKRYKRNGIINIYTSVSWSILYNNINISTECGRCVRPLFIIEDNELLFNKHHVLALIQGKINWKNIVSPNTISDPELRTMFKDPIVEFLDVEEQNSSMIAMSLRDLHRGQKGAHLGIKYTHMEIHPSLILGVLASNIPFPDHNQSPRNCYQSAMGKQAIGIYATNYQKRLDTLGHVLNYPQQPLVKTNMHKLLNSSNMPCGMNVIVAIATYTGFNQEDSIMVNRSSVDRGLFNSTFYRTYKEQCNKNLSTGEEEIFCRLDANSEANIKRPFNYDKLGEDGFIDENVYVQSGDIMIGKYMPQKIQNSVFVNKDHSVVVKNNESGYIDMKCAHDKYFKNTSSEGYNFAKIKVRDFRQPTIGDKLSSTSGQKGTIGMMYRQEDMPFNKDGLVPDIIINPHAIPSRMTIAQLLETIMGKACTVMGAFGNATPFTNIDVNEMTNILQKECGLEKTGNEILYNSRTGEQMNTNIFMGPTYYQRLKHMVCDKMHSRNSNGPIVLLTRQPAEGRARDGGLRLGEMEVECNWAHGTMFFLKERFMECSDNYRIFVCKRCNRPANVNPDRKKYKCYNCSNKINFAEVRIPFASKLLMQEIQSMSIGTRFLTS
jgi:DNA-directed RNA polymerase II subunit RPB2